MSNASWWHLPMPPDASWPCGPLPTPTDLCHPLPTPASPLDTWHPLPMPLNALGTPSEAWRPPVTPGYPCWPLSLMWLLSMPPDTCWPLQNPAKSCLPLLILADLCWALLDPPHGPIPHLSSLPDTCEPLLTPPTPFDPCHPLSMYPDEFWSIFSVWNENRKRY